MRSSIRIRLTVAFIGLAIGPLLLVGIILAWQNLTVQEQQALNLQHEVAQRVAAEVTAFFSTVENQLRVVSQVQGLQSLDREQQRHTLSELLIYEDIFEELVLLDHQGQEQIHLSRINPIANLDNRAKADAFIIPQTTEQVYYSPVRFDETTGEPFMTIAAPLVDARTGLTDGVLLSEVRIKKIWDLIADIRVSPGQSVYIVDTLNTIIAHRNPSLVLQGAIFNVPDQDGVQPGLDGSSTVMAVDKLHFGPQEFNIVVEQKWIEAMALAINSLYVIGGVMLFTLILAGGLGFFVVRQIVRPIQAMASTAQAISAGDLTQQVTITGQDELSVLAKTFNRMTSQLHDLIDSLEDQIHERTAELTLSLEVGQRVSAIRNLQELLPIITEFIRERFNLYYTQIYFVDDLGQNLVLQAGTGEVGQMLLARRHTLPIGKGSIVGQVAVTHKSIVVPDTENSEIHKPNPLLPDTRSELAVPLMVEGRVIGVLDMQADRPKTFILSSVTVFEAMAAQLANSIDSAQQFSLAQAAQRKAEEAVQQFTRQGWAERLATHKGGLGFIYNLSAITSLTSANQLSQKHKSSQSLPAVKSLVAPLVVQNQSVGQLAVATPADKNWSHEEQAFVNAVAQQLAQKAENIRLFEQTQQRAAREQLARQISDKVRASRDIDSALKTAAEELVKTLGAARAVVNLQLAPNEAPTNNSENS